MNQIISLLQSTMERPTMYGWYHILWIILTIAFVLYFWFTRKFTNEKRVKRVFLIYGLLSLALEIIKQVIWSYEDGIWDYQFYAAPFQFCTTPIYVTLLYCILKNKNIKEDLLCYLSFFTILGGLSVIFYPDSCFCRTIEVNIHTMVLHCGSFIISVFIFMNNLIKINFKSVLKGLKVFVIFVAIALLLDVGFYHSGILNGETFNMFYVSPYFISELPLFNVLQENLPYILFLLIYIIIIFLGGSVIFGISSLFSKKKSLKKK